MTIHMWEGFKWPNHAKSWIFWVFSSFENRFGSWRHFAHLYAIDGCHYDVEFASVSVCTAKLGCNSNAPMRLSISESLGAKVNSTKAGTHSRFVAENDLDASEMKTQISTPISLAASHWLKRLFPNTRSRGRAFP